MLKPLNKYPSQVQHILLSLKIVSSYCKFLQHSCCLQFVCMLCFVKMHCPELSRPLLSPDEMSFMYLNDFLFMENPGRHAASSVLWSHGCFTSVCLQVLVCVGVI